MRSRGSDGKEHANGCQHVCRNSYAFSYCDHHAGCNGNSFPHADGNSNPACCADCHQYADGYVGCDQHTARNDSLVSHSNCDRLAPSNNCFVLSQGLH